MHQRIFCEADCHHNDGGRCGLRQIRIITRGLDTNCQQFERLLPPNETTRVFTYGKPNDTVELGPFD
ncbi:DUF1540 domain-containing protein [Calderihabitans maritimus]|uniref:Phosphoribosyl-AMP cyclohydrolase n=1 Tax=Calderihabitans maritimus TaxID=1246530 RepID=A0A1Z5HSU6_9FIRM|nr:hypothetical protein [Calderihabitans maritimus]GAW92603.1 phosphoribosyl-AMP cyclohydrolase [Calderihabitans maritimus]